MASEVTVDLEDLRTLLIRAEKAFCTLENKHDPIIGVVDRLTDKVCVVSMRNALEKREAEQIAQKVWHDTSRGNVRQ